MTESLLAAEPTLRLAAFLGVLAIMALWEIAAPRRRREIPRVIRWTNNLALVAVDTAILRLTFPVLAVGLALMAEQRGWGLLNVFAVPSWLAILLSILVLDLVIYLQHVMFHAILRCGGCTGCIMPIWNSTPRPASGSTRSKSCCRC